MDGLFEHLPAIISAAAQSVLGLFALLSVALAMLAYFFFAKALDITQCHERTVPKLSQRLC